MTYKETTTMDYASIFRIALGSTSARPGSVKFNTHRFVSLGYLGTTRAVKILGIEICSLGNLWLHAQRVEDLGYRTYCLDRIESMELPTVDDMKDLAKVYDYKKDHHVAPFGINVREEKASCHV